MRRSGLLIEGCRCQAFLLAADVAVTDPVSYLSPHHVPVEEAAGVVEPG